MNEPYDFAIANRAFELFTLTERERALEVFARLQFPSITDRFFEAVDQVIRETQVKSAVHQADSTHG